MELFLTYDLVANSSSMLSLHCSLHSGPMTLYGLKLALPMVHLEDIGLLAQHLPVNLASYPGKLPPSLKVLGVPLISVSILGVLPVPWIHASAIDIQMRRGSTYPWRRRSVS